MLELAGLFAEDNDGLPAIKSVNLKVKAGEIVGIAGVSGNGQSALVEALCRPAAALRWRHLHPRRAGSSPSAAPTTSYKVFGLPEEPLKNATVPKMSVAENIAFRSFDKPPVATLGWWMSPGPMRDKARGADRALPGEDARGRTRRSRRCRGGNVQRAVLAREL